MDGIIFSRLRFRKFIAIAAGAALACLAPSAAHAAATVFATAIERFTPLSPVTAERSLLYRVTFNAAVTGVDASDFALTVQVGNGTGTVSSVLGTGAVRYVRVAVTGYGGEFRLDLKATGTGIVDTSGNTLGAGFTAGQAYTLLADTAAAVWGRNDGGQLGLGFTGAPATPTVLTSTLYFAQLAGGPYHSLAANANGALYAWGDNYYGQLGNNSTTAALSPILVSNSGALNGRTIIAAAAGTSHSLALDTTGRIYAWGLNTSNQLGDGTNTQRLAPVAVPTDGALSGKTIVAIAAGANHSLALSADGLVFAWGANTYGQLGDASNTQRPLPVAVSTAGVLAGKQIVAIAAGVYHSLALSADGQLFAWGNNAQGQLGNNSTTGSNIPVAVSTSGALAGKRIVALSAGYHHSLALSADNLLFAWGDNLYGQLGNNLTDDSLVPTAVDQTGVLAARQIVGLSAGYRHNLVLTSDGQVAAWGSGNYAQLGSSTIGQSRVPLVPNTATALGLRRPFALGQGAFTDHVQILASPEPATVTGVTLPGAGTYHPGQSLEFDVTFSRAVYFDPANPPRLELVVGSQTVLATCTAGIGTTVLTFTYSPLAGQGDTDGITLGRILGTILASNSAPANLAYTPPATTGILVDGIAPTATAIRRYSPAGGPTTAHTLVYRVSFSEPVTGVVPTDFTLRTGAFPYTISNTTGTIASVAGSDTEWYVTVTGVTGLGAVELKIKTSGTGIQDTHGNALAASYPTSEWFGHRDQALALSWGSNENGQLGNGTTGSATNTNRPGLVDATGVLAGRDIVALEAGINYSAALDAEGKLYAWGLGYYGMLGNGTTIDTALPLATATTGAGAGKSYLAVSIGWHSLALTTEGQVLAWGYNAYGQLGDGSNAAFSSSPVAVVGLPAGTPVVAVATGGYHSLALTADGRVYTWGHNFDGQLGDGTNDDRATPVLVQGALAGQHVIAIAAGHKSSLALTADGHVYAWGRNFNGQLGDGTTDDRSSPVLVSGGALAGLTVRAIAAGTGHSLAITSSGQCLGWGSNESYKLGDGTNTNRLLPTAVSTGGALNGKIVSQIAAGDEFSYALSIAAGTLYAWGANSNGQLGDGTNTDRNTPVQLGATGELLRRRPLAISTSSSRDHALAVASDLTHCTAVSLPAPGSYRAGTVLNFTLAFDHPVNVWNTALPRLWLGNGYYAEYVPGAAASTDSLVFRHTVAAGENLPAGVSLGNDLDLNGGTITDGSGWNIDLALPSGLDTSGIKIDTTAPDGAFVTRYNPATATTAATTVVYRVTFSEGVVGVDASDFTLTATGDMVGASFASFDGSGRVRYITLNVPAGTSGSLRLDVNSGGISDYAGNPFSNSYAGETYTRAASIVPVAWGQNSSGQLGNGGDRDANTPVPIVATGALAGRQLVALASGEHHTLAVADDGRAYAWGNNSGAVLGCAPDSPPADNTAVAVNATSYLAGKKIVAVAAGSNFSLALSAEGKVYAWGTNAQGQLGTNYGDVLDTPWPVDDTGYLTADDHIVAIAAGSLHALALSADGKVYSWGFNSSGQLGDGTTNQRTAPFDVSKYSILSGKRIIAIAAGVYHSLALSDEGRVYAWGAGGCVGTGTGENSLMPVAVDTSTGLGNDFVTAIAAGEYHSLALTVTKRLYTWGTNHSGQCALDQGSTSYLPRPTRIDQTGALAGQTIAAIGAGACHSFATTNTGLTYVWGDNTAGQLGAATPALSSFSPQPLDTAGTLAGHTLLSLASGPSSWHTVALATGRAYSRSEVWRGRYFGSSADAGPGADTADPDADGRSNLLEYATRTNPLTPNPGSPVALTTAGTDTTRALSLTFDYNNDPELHYFVEASTSLAPDSWEAIWHQWFLSATSGAFTVTDPEFMANHPRRFLRLVVLRDPWVEK